MPCSVRLRSPRRFDHSSASFASLPLRGLFLLLFLLLWCLSCVLCSVLGVLIIRGLSPCRPPLSDIARFLRVWFYLRLNWFTLHCGVSITRLLGGFVVALGFCCVRVYMCVRCVCAHVLLCEFCVSATATVFRSPAGFRYFLPSCILSLLLCLLSVCMSLHMLLPCCLAFACVIMCLAICEPSMLLSVLCFCGGCSARPPSLFFFCLVSASLMCPDCVSAHCLCLLFSSGFIRRHGNGSPLIFSLPVAVSRFVWQSVHTRRPAPGIHAGLQSVPFRPSP